MNSQEEEILLLKQKVCELQKEGKKRPYCFNPKKNMNDCDTPLWEDKHIMA